MNITQATKKITSGKIAVPKYAALDDLKNHPVITVDGILGSLNNELLLADWVVVPEHFLSAGGVFIRTYKKNHPLLGIPEEGYIPKAARTFIKEYCAPKVHRVSVAYRNGKVIGFSRFYIDSLTYCDAGTWVEPDHRRFGLALSLAESVLNYKRRVILTAISKAGLKLAYKLRDKHANIHVRNKA